MTSERIGNSRNGKEFYERYARETGLQRIRIDRLKHDRTQRCQIDFSQSARDPFECGVAHVEALRYDVRFFFVFECWQRSRVCIFRLISFSFRDEFSSLLLRVGSSLIAYTCMRSERGEEARVHI